MFGGKLVLLRDAKGLHYLAQLLQHAGEKVSAIQLAAEGGVTGQAPAIENLERARSAVTKRIRDALDKIEKNHPQLGRHLSAHVKTGSECMYSPDPDQPVIWQL